MTLFLLIPDTKFSMASTDCFATPSWCMWRHSPGEARYILWGFSPKQRLWNTLSTGWCKHSFQWGSFFLWRQTSKSWGSQRRHCACLSTSVKWLVGQLQWRHVDLMVELLAPYQVQSLSWSSVSPMTKAMENFICTDHFFPAHGKLWHKKPLPSIAILRDDRATRRPLWRLMMLCSAADEAEGVFLNCFDDMKELSGWK